MAIHPTACVESGADLGEDVEVGPFAFVATGARVGDGCRIGPHAVIYPFARLGASCSVHAGAVIADVPQDLDFEDVESFVEIGDGCVVREGVTIHRGTVEGSSTTVGNECFLMANCHLAHNVRLGNKVILANGALLAGYVEVGDGTFVAGLVGVHQFVRVGRLVMLGGASSISQDVPPFCMTRSGALNTVSGLNVVGMRRAGMTLAERTEVKNAFQLLYRSGSNTREAVARIQADSPDGPARELADFAAVSKRGICGSSRPIATRREDR